jgi:hypothetical protein
MGFLFAHKKTSSIPEFTGLQVQTAVNVLPIALIYGSPRVQVNLIYANGFRKAQVSTGGGKGLLSGGKGGAKQTNYYATFIAAFGEGTIGPIRVVYDDQAVYDLGSIPTHKNYTFFSGTDTQAPWSTIVSLYPNDAFGYKDTAYVGCFDYLLDSSATIPQLNFALDGLFAQTIPLNFFTWPGGSQSFPDADPALVVNDFLTNPRYGVGFPAAFIDTNTLFTSANGFDPTVGDAALSTFCQAVGMGWSVILNNTEPASSILERWFKNLVVAPVWTGAILKFIPYWDMFSGLNPGFSNVSGAFLKYYKPNTTPLFDFTDDDFEQAPEGDDPVTVTRIDIADVKNTVRLDFRDRFNLYNDNVAEAKDEVTASLFGTRVERMGTADEFTHINYAAVSTQQQLQRNIAVRNTYTFRLGWQWCILDPMDIVTITDTTLGLVKFPVRIRTIEEDEKGVLTFVAEEFRLGAASATAYPRQANTPPTTVNTNQAAPAVNTPFIFEPTEQALAADGLSAPTLVIGSSAGPGGVYNSLWGGANVYASNDNVTYTLFTPTITGPSRQGVTTATLPAFSGTNPDNINTLAVDLTESNGTLDSVTPAQAAAGLSLCAIKDTAGDVELLSYTTATLTAPNKYNLTGLYRGLYGTIPCAYPSGSQFLRVDSNVFQAPIPSAFIGKSFYIKLQSFNIFGGGLQDLSTCTAYQYTSNGAGTNILVDPIWSALLAGINVDLNTAGSDDLDLNIGGGGACAPVLSTVDLGTS